MQTAQYQQKLDERRSELELEHKILGRYLSLQEHLQFWKLVARLRKEPEDGNQA